MPRPYGPRFFAFLLLACAAIVAIAMIPRGVVRAIEASQFDHHLEVDAGSVHLTERPSHGSELPGVRAVVSREERELAAGAAEVGDTVPGTVALHAVDGVPSAEQAASPGDPSQQLATTTRSRAPPPSI